MRETRTNLSGNVLMHHTNIYLAQNPTSMSQECAREATKFNTGRGTRAHLIAKPCAQIKSLLEHKPEKESTRI